MKRAWVAFTISLLAVIGLLLALWWGKLGQPTHTKITAIPNSSPAAVSPSPSLSAPTANPQLLETQGEHRKKTVAKVLSILATPISFYGRVVDQNGNPIPDADVDYGVIDKFDADGSNYHGKSDESGNFVITGVKGAVLTVGVRKVGYYNIHGKSDSAFAYGVGPDPTRKEPPTSDKPAIFVLQRMGSTESLLHVSSHQYKVPKSGEPLEIDLTTGKTVPMGQGNIRVERWVNDKIEDANGRFDWWFRLTAPNGGLVERQDRFAFQAPIEGYRESIEINMPTSLGEDWHYTLEKSYFIKMRNGQYARADLRIYSGHENSLVMESFINPTGGRNLEYDATKELKSTANRTHL